MEVLNIVAFSSLALIALTSIFIRRRLSGGGAPKRLPPGSLGWPLIGETIEFLYGKPEKFVGYRMKKYSRDIFKTKILGEKTVVICGHKATNSYSPTRKNTDFRPHSMQRLFRSYQNKSSASASSAPPTNPAKAIRQPGFLKPEALMRFLAKMDSITQQQLQVHWSDHHDTKTLVQVYPLAKTVTLTMACHFLLGINDPERISRLVEHFDAVAMGMHSMIVDVPGTNFYGANKAVHAITKELVSVVKEKKQKLMDCAGCDPMHDILSHMIVSLDSSGRSNVSDSEIARMMIGMLTAGYTTVSTTITFLMKYVGLNSEVYERLRTEQMGIARTKKKAGELLEWDDMGKMKYSWNVICETIRLVPPLQGTFREVLQEFTYAGYTIPKGWKVYWTVSTTNMNPEYFKDPETFNPSRYEEGEPAPPAYSYVPFGGGPRMCPGKEYARLAILTFIHNVVKIYKWEVMDPNEKVVGDMMPAPQMGLPIRLHHYN